MPKKPLLPPVNRMPVPGFSSGMFRIRRTLFRFIDDDTLELAKMIFRGKINTEILAALRQRGIHAVGLSGVDGGVIKAVRRPPKDIVNKKTGETETVDFGHVGDIVEIDTRLINLLLENGYLPVISSLGASETGEIYNINADTVASEMAAELGAEKLILLSDVNGIYLDESDESTKISRLSAADAHVLVHTKHDSHVLAFRRSRDNDLLYAASNVLNRILCFCEAARRFDHDLSTNGFPRNHTRILFGKNLEFLTFDLDNSIARLDLVIEISHYRIVLE